MSFHTTISSISVNFGHCTFTGKERDEETGYGYFGARYMDHELMTMWLSVDPLADKYPNISPYAYCAWNPIKLIDPDGQEVEYSSFQDRCFVLAARILSKGFRMRYNDLKDSKEVYVFNYNDKGINKLTTDGDKLYINYSVDQTSKKEGSTVISLLRHETEHAVQFEYGEVGFQKDKNGKWCSMNFDIDDELKARDFEASSSFMLSAHSIQSIWGREGWGLEDRDDKINYLRGCGYTAPDVVMNNTSADVGKDGTKFALQHRMRPY